MRARLPKEDRDIPEPAPTTCRHCWMSQCWQDFPVFSFSPFSKGPQIPYRGRMWKGSGCFCEPEVKVEMRSIGSIWIIKLSEKECSLVLAVPGGANIASRRKKSKHMKTSAVKRHWRNSFVLMWEVHQPPVQHPCTLSDTRVPVAIPYLGIHGITLWNTWMSGEGLSFEQKLSGCQSSASRGRLGWAFSPKLAPPRCGLVLPLKSVSSFSFYPIPSSSSLSGSKMHHKPAPHKRRELWVFWAQKSSDFFV